MRAQITGVSHLVGMCSNWDLASTASAPFAHKSLQQLLTKCDM